MRQYMSDIYQQMYQCKLELRASHRSVLSAQANLLSECLSPNLRHAFDAVSEWGTSCWLATLPIAEHGFALPKGEFLDALYLRFDWQPVNLPQTSVCGKPFSVEHAFTCPCGGFQSIRCNINEIKDLTAEWSVLWCWGWAYSLTIRSWASPACLCRQRRWCLLLGIFRERIGSMRSLTLGCLILQFARSYSCLPFSRCYQTREQEKRWTYDERIQEVERTCFFPFVFAATLGMGCTICHYCLQEACLLRCRLISGV